MPDFSKRSAESELLDDLSVPFEAIRQNMQELNTINSLLGGHAVTMKGVQKIWTGEKKISICEVGCGGGDNLFAIYQWLQKKGIEAKLTGVDMNEHCIRFAEEQYGGLGIDFICSDYKKASFTVLPDIIFSALFCHHFTEKELAYMLQWMRDHCNRGFFINDLHRHPLAWWSIKWLTRFFSNSYLVKNDAPLSVLRGFTRKEWLQLTEGIGMVANIRWEWAFRHLIVYKK